MSDQFEWSRTDTHTKSNPLLLLIDDIELGRTSSGNKKVTKKRKKKKKTTTKYEKIINTQVTHKLIAIHAAVENLFIIKLDEPKWVLIMILCVVLTFNLIESKITFEFVVWCICQNQSRDFISSLKSPIYNVYIFESSFRQQREE